MKIATWNINGIKARLETVEAWLKEAEPDIACFQEIKSEDASFPRQIFEDMGYNVETHGQKGFNGVAILSRLPFEEVNRGLDGDTEDAQARFIEGVFSCPNGPLRVASLYLPNGNPVDSDKYPYKLRWMQRLHGWAQKHLALEEAFILAGDYNVIPQPDDCHNPTAWQGDALFRPETRAAFNALLSLGLSDAIRSVSAEKAYTFWDYQAGAWQKDFGIRIDHLLLSPEAAMHLYAANIDKHIRGWEKPSDHVPVWIDYRPRGPMAQSV